MMLDLNGALAERSQDNPFDALMGDNYKTYGLDDILSSIKKAKENDNIKGIYIASLLRWVQAFASLRGNTQCIDWISRKAENSSLLMETAIPKGLYYLSSVADKVLLNPQGMIEWRGIGRYPHVSSKICWPKSE